MRLFWCRVDLWVFQISRRSALLSLPQLSLLLSPAQMAYQALQLGEVTVNAKGAKLALLTNGGERFHYTTPSPLRAPFGGPSNFDKDKEAPRQNLELRCTEEVAAFFKGLDGWAVEYISAHSSAPELRGFGARGGPRALERTGAPTPTRHTSPWRGWAFARGKCP